MTAKRRSVSMRALDEIRDTLMLRVKSAYHGGSIWDSDKQEYRYYPITEAHEKLKSSKDAIIKKISKEVEDYCVKKYAEYGVIIVPVCHRSSSNGEDRLEIDLKVKKFVGTEKELAAVLAVEKEFYEHMKSIDDWYYGALKAIAAREDLPEPPVLKLPEA